MKFLRKNNYISVYGKTMSSLFGIPIGESFKEFARIKYDYKECLYKIYFSVNMINIDENDLLSITIYLIKLNKK